MALLIGDDRVPTGKPAGVGVIEFEFSGIGVLRNRIVSA